MELGQPACCGRCFAEIIDSTAPCRLTLVVERKRTRLSAVLDSARTMLRKNAQSSWVTPEGVSFSCNSKPGKLGILFPGQGAQYTGMLRDIACRFPQMLETLANADRDFIPAEGALLSDLIYPASPFDDETKDRQEAFCVPPRLPNRPSARSVWGH